MTNSSALASFSGHVVLVGAGQMGGALLKGWLRLGIDPHKITVLDPHVGPAIKAQIDSYGVELNPSDITFADVLVLAIKPQMADDVLPKLNGLIGKTTLVLSVMAGKTIGGMQSVFGKDRPVIRTIPNTPAQVGRGMTAAYASPQVSAAQKQMAHELLSAVGAVEWLSQESLIDAATAVSGSGPAYVFYLVEALARAGEVAGLPHDIAAKLARVTIEGAGELLHSLPTIPPATLRQNVTSPNGTTHAALQVMMGAHGIDPIIEHAVQAATRRSKELAG
jgi:pyrroline-5-carboxylate reductase